MAMRVVHVREVRVLVSQSLVTAPMGMRSPVESPGANQIRETLRTALRFEAASSSCCAQCPQGCAD